MTKEQIKDFTFRVTQENDSGLIVILFEIEHVYLGDAIKAYADGKIKEYLFNIEAAKKTHNELMKAMNPENADALKVLSILRFIFSRLVDSCVKKQPQDIERCMLMLEKIKTIFDEIHKQDTSEPVMKNTHQVYAGLTYGKGSLTESYGTADYSNRGYRI